MAGPYRMWGAQPSYFTGKLRAYLNWKRVPYVDQVANAGAYASDILPRTGLPYIPILVTPEDTTLQDTSDILDEMERRHPARPVVPDDPVLALASHLMELYGDECLIFPALHYRWNKPEAKAWVMGEFDRSASHAMPEAIAMGAAFAERIQSYLPLLGLDRPEVQAAAERVYARFLDRFEAHLATSDYLLGASPTLGDFALMGPLYAHLYRDVGPGATLMRTRAPRVADWVERMNGSAGAPDPEGWTLTDTARALFAEIGAGFARMLADLHRAVDGTLAGLDPAAKLPRAAGPIDTMLLDTPLSRMAPVYTVWMLQRVRDRYAALGDEDRARADAFLDEIGCAEIVGFRTNWRLEKERFKLVLRR